MTIVKNEDVLKSLSEAFSGLRNEELENLKWHREQGTTVLCGDMYSYFTDGAGGG